MPKLMYLIVLVATTVPELLLIVLLCLGGFAYQYCATKRDEFRYPAPGKLIDVGGYQLHLYCTGKGRPTVVLDAGMGANLTWWALVQKDVSRFAKVCSFDRAGYGWSDAGPEPRTSEKIVHELHRLLHATPDTPPPYILVGHSFGGATMRLYANTFPDEVFGLVLVDACHENQDQDGDDEAEKPSGSLFKRWWGYVVNSSFAHYSGITRWNMPASMKPFFSDLLSDDLKKIIVAKASSVKSLQARDSEWAHFRQSLDQLKQSINRLTHKPLIVISCGKHEGDDAASEVALQNALASLSRQSKQVIAENSGHMINVKQPATIVDAIGELVKKYDRAVT